MTYYAELDASKRVLRVVVCDTVEWLQSRLGGAWVEIGPTTAQTNGAGPGLYDGEAAAPRRFVTHGGNRKAPGVSGWRDPLNEWPEWVQPTGAHDAYNIGAKVTFQGNRYTSKINANVWSPTGYPAGWQLQP